MPSLNRVILCGRLGVDPEVRATQKGMAVANLSLGVTDYSNEGEKTNWYDVTVWGKTAEVVDQYCTKGSLILVEGRLSVDNWEAKDGTKRKKVFVTGEKLQLLNSISEGKKMSEPVEEETDSFTF
jgi:single-strand DNA-binding protein|tara:strand:+ start:2480 stop:2854 length:375 start_codon:yes stop_codon:yes gene_type:complete